jgi:hypothetical protein
MPEMQLFGLPADKINTGDVMTITYLKAEDEAGHLHDILGKHQKLPFRSVSYYYGTVNYTYFRVYIGTLQNIKATDRQLYLDVHGINGKVTGSASVAPDWSNAPYRDFAIYGDHRILAYFELYIYSADNERIVLSNGYTGGVL